MNRRSLANLVSAEETDLSQAWDWYEFQRALIGEERSRVLEALARGGNVGMSRHVGKTRDELDGDFAFQIDELDQLAMLGMLASTEAAMRIDFIERVSFKKKDDVSRKFRDAYKRRKRRIERIRLEEEILDGWKSQGDVRIGRAVAEFKGALNLRHWLAHGRYWRPKLGRAAGYDPADVFDICKELLQAVGLLPPDTP